MTSKLKPEIKAKWLELLRADPEEAEYEQGFGQLYSSHTKDPTKECAYCAMGLLVKAKQDVLGEDIPEEFEVVYPDVSVLTQCLIPEYSLESFLVRVFSLHTLGSEEATSVWKLNDRSRLSFSEIADLVEEQL